MAWTDEQKQIIENRGASILVSAAAGSGKTSVLVERIIKKLTDKDNPCDIDEFLVVTFTKAAAAQMKEKIAGKIEAALLENPDDEHLMKQLHLVNRADINTIDSFCLKLVKENFGMLNIDSSFTIADTGMVKMMQSEVLDQLFEDKFSLERDSAEKKEFEMLLDIFGKASNDEGLKDMITAVYDTAASFPEVEKWFDGAKQAYDCEDIDKIPWIQAVVREEKSRVYDAKQNALAAHSICTMHDGPLHYTAAIESDLERFDDILQANTYRELCAKLDYKWATLGRAKKTDIFDADLAETCKGVRNAYKKSVDAMKKLNKREDKIITELSSLKSYMLPLLTLTEEFIRRFDLMKQTRRLLTFSDVEHLAYGLLCVGHDEAGNVVPSDVGRSISKRYKEIYIDEYQDSNFLQEDILRSVSKYYKNEPNMFMVGDIKQSIYRFRMARPDIFIEKYKRFSDSGKEIRIELKNNFRSRDIVLNPINYMFYQIMGEDLGGVVYDEHIALVPSKKFSEPDESIQDRISKNVELHVIETNSVDENGVLTDENSELTEEEQNLDGARLEANVIADRIIEMTSSAGGTYIYDEETETYRISKYSDIVILLRGIKDYGESIRDVLTERGIPVYLDESKGYFNAVEIRTMMSFLSVIDNSRDDIALAALLLSPIGGFDESELAMITAYAVLQDVKSTCLYDKCQCYMLDTEDGISKKLNRIFDIVSRLKDLKKKVSISELIYTALEMTGYYEYAAAMPMGRKRKANIDMLLEKAKSFEDGYYKGLFNFLRYIEKLKLNDMDFGEASFVSAEDNVVRITTMHKSKGLEYPIVFVSGLGKWHNEMDARKNTIIHSDYFLAGKLINLKHRFKSDSFMREAFKLLLKSEAMGEELRILYVALTRAKEKLIMTGAVKGLAQILDKQESLSAMDERLLPYSVRRDSRSFLILILAAMQRYNKKEFIMGAGFDQPCEIAVSYYSRAKALAGAISGDIKVMADLSTYRLMAIEKNEDEAYKIYKERFSWEYEYEAFTSMRSKLPISDIKKMKAYDGEGFDVDVSRQFKDKEIEGADISHTDYGTMIHKIMELISFSACLEASNSLVYIKDFLKKLISDNIFTDDEIRLVSAKKIYGMISSSLGKRMAKADKEGRLYKEQQFSIGILADEIYSSEKRVKKTDDVIVVQGIVDAFFYEDDALVVVDYKTDRTQEEELISRYRAQLDYYAMTIETLTGKSVKEKLMYSFALGKEVKLD